MKKKRSGAKGLYQDGAHLVIREGAKFPDRCAICNEACDGGVVDFTFKREKSHYIDVAAVQAVAQAATDLVKGSRYTGEIRVAVPLCPWHRKRRLLRVGIGAGIAVLPAAYLLYRYSTGGAAQFRVLQISAASVVAMIAALIGIVVAMTALGNRTQVWFRPAKYYDRFIWLRGAGGPFLRTLPELQEHHYNPDAVDPHLSAEELIRRGESE